jgi:hypothetical protein
VSVIQIMENWGLAPDAARQGAMEAAAIVIARANWRIVRVCFFVLFRSVGV